MTKHVPHIAIATSPDAGYPSLRDSLAGSALVGQALAHYLGESAPPDDPGWNPLAAWIRPGQRVFVLANHVMHRRLWESEADFQAKCTQAAVLAPVLRYALRAVGPDGRVSFGNAPLQGCDYARVTEETGAAELGRILQQNSHSDIGPHDLRQVVTRWSAAGALLGEQTRSDVQMVTLDLGHDSILEGLPHGPGQTPEFRVYDYPPAATMAYHGPNRHVYALNRQVLDADVIISVPKLKTHEKVGLTCALKGSVGAVARKECLAHHRRGGAPSAGDEFPGSSLLLELASCWMDRTALRSQGLGANLRRIASSAVYRFVRYSRLGILGGGWHGNDTAWRMALDLARTLRYGRLDGTLSDEPVRPHLVVVDAIVAGEGEGPLRPSPRRIGAVLFSPDPCAADMGCALVMGYEPECIPLVARSFGQFRYPLTAADPGAVTFSVNGSDVTAHALSRRFAPPFAPPRGWRGALRRPRAADAPVPSP